MWKPEVGKYYSKEDGVPELKVTENTIPPPEEMDLMSLIFAYNMEKQIEAEARDNCEACKVNSDSQFDHCQTGNCLDTKINQNHVYFKPAKKRIKVEELINVLDKVHSEIGVKPILPNNWKNVQWLGFH